MEFINDVFVDNRDVEVEEATHVQEHELVEVRIRYIH